ncbi:MAG TPA: DUF3500 domain-containing protein [Methylomirabilota bacterium]|nr:DUF3500 domain-containing protein [Methylomirabilota bacterium]
MTTRSLTRLCLASFALLVGGAFHAPAHPHTDEMAEAAKRFLSALNEEQSARAVFPLADDERLNWHFVPKDRKGLPWKEMTPAQQQLAVGLLGSGLSNRGLLKTTTIMSLEQVLRELENRAPHRDPGLYYVSIFGKPESHATWGWRFEGHHLSLNFTIVDGHHVATTPSFLGANPAEVREGPRKGLRALGPEEDAGRALVKALDANQQREAIISDRAPRDVITGADRKVEPLAWEGLPASKMSAPQMKLLWELIEEYVRRHRPEIADTDLEKIREAGAEKIHFAWAGSLEPGQGHYYRVQGPTFLLEYDNTQNNANHIHAVWRDFENDFGIDLLREHYDKVPHDE